MKDQQKKKTSRFKPGQTFSWESAKSGNSGKSDNRRRNRPKTRVPYAGQTLTFTTVGKPILVNDVPYRGFLSVAFSETGATVVNHVSLEDYVRGVVSLEIGSKSAPGTLQAQAVIARTYAFANRGRHQSEGFDICPTTHCQVYGGAKAERDTTDAAIAATRGIVMISEGEQIATLYHATCGGMTSDNDKVFGGHPRSYLRRVHCPFCTKGTNYRWSRSLPLASLREKLRQEKITFLTLFAAESCAPALLDRVDNVVLSTNTGRQVIKGTTFRRLFDLPSTTFMIRPPRPTPTVAKPALPSASPPTAGQPVPADFEIIAAPLVPDIASGPPQLVLQTAAGLVRQRRPIQGWFVLAAKTRPIPATPLPTTKITLPHRTVPLNSISLFGRGFGHQVGLCQSGAQELGRRGWTYRQILAFYYSNVALRQLIYEGGGHE